MKMNLINLKTAKFKHPKMNPKIRNQNLIFLLLINRKLKRTIPKKMERKSLESLLNLMILKRHNPQNSKKMFNHNRNRRTKVKRK